MEALFTRAGVERQPNGKTEKGAPLFRSKKTCFRCGGAGGAEAWRHTGWTCYRCGGNGTDPNPLEEKLYTAEKLVKLNAAQAKRDEKKRIAREEAAAAEAARIERERDGVRAEYADLVARIRAAAPLKFTDEFDEQGVDPLEGEGFLASIYRQLTVQFRPLSENQQSAIENVLAKIEAEQIRIKKADWVGVEGQRIEMTLTLEKVITFGDQYDFGGVTFMCIMKTPEGSKVIYRGKSPHSLGFASEYDRDAGGRVYPLNQTTTLVAMIKEHRRSTYNGEPETYIIRPKALENVK